ncbi:acylglycerol kinase, mitochondrial [Drosophila mojavensis]|uniref:acylglycerol kinase, mitochondrial n=1 Tax=Drosophila mojavensis TaxID=7230 RepID=UPI001CD0FC9B|nr:acylglycerol kinase, mitochondrial [Drosophila mojavensis]
MNTLKLIRNNWKKSLFLSCVVGYGVSTIKTKLDIKLYMNKLSNEVLHSNQTTNVLPKNVLVIMNPIAKKKKAENLFKKYCEPLLHLAGFSVEILRTNHIGHAKTYVEEMSALPDVIVVAGGDGTKSEVVTGLLRRQGEICPISLLPLGREKASGFKIFNFGSELEFVKTLCQALLPLLNNQYKYVDVIQYDVLDEENNNENDSPSNNLKPIFGINGFSWGLLKDIDTLKDKYWYVGPLRHHLAAFFRSFSGTANWDSKTDYVYTPPCPGCSNCCPEVEDKPTKGFFLSKLVKTQNVSRAATQKLIKNDSCATKLSGCINSNQININLSHNEENFSELESKFIDSLQPGWDLIKNIPKITNKTVEPNLVLKSRTIKLYPSVSDEPIFYSIDGEEYEPRPIQVSIVPNAIKVFC